MRATVVVRTFNNEDILEQTLISLESQKMFYSDLIIIDSGSTDKTLEIAL